MEKFLYYNALYLIYKNLINDKTSEIFDLYYGENLSMQEIADLKNISKSRVGIIIKNVEKKLDNYENALGIYQKNNKLTEILELNNLEKIKEEIEKIIKGE
ncbi:MAG: DNA-binding protein [Firmicutes bacterium]|nr:DNA-binding protein [Bacillota bacterium]